MSFESADSPIVDPVPSYARDGEPVRRRRPLVPPLPAWIVFAAALLAAILIANIGLLDGAHSNVLALIFTFVAFMSMAICLTSALERWPIGNMTFSSCE